MSYFMASVDPLDDNVAFAKATSVNLGNQVGGKEEADFLILSDPTKRVATEYGVLEREGSRTAGPSTSARRAGSWPSTKPSGPERQRRT
jgi:hypothetical protein